MTESPGVVNRGADTGSSPLRVAVVGPGGWGRQHIRVFTERSDTTVVAIVGRNDERVRRQAAEAGTTGYTDIAAMLTPPSRTSSLSRCRTSTTSPRRSS